MIKLFNETDTTFSSNGDVVLNPTYAVVHKEDNGDFYLDLETNLTNETKTIPSEAGTNITINGSTQITADANKEVEIVDIKGQTTQSSTPSPTSPVPINVVTGEQDINVCGKNLFDKNNMTLSYYLDSNGTPSASVYWDISNYINVTPNTKYTYKGLTQVGSSSVQSVYYDINKTKISTFKQATGTNTITTPNNCYYVRFSITKNQVTDKDTFMIEKGETSSNYEAYTGNTYEINLGKNLLTKEGLSTPTNDTDFWLQTDYVTPLENGWCRYQATNTTSSQMFVNTFTKPQALDIEPSTQYTIVVEFRNINTIGTSNNKLTICQNRNDELFTNSMDVTINGTQKVISTTKSNINTTTGLRVFYRLYANESVDFEARVSVIKGDYSINNFEYAPYKTPIELCKIGTYQDKIYKDNGIWYLHKEIGKVILDGNTTGWSGGSVATNVYRFYKNIDGIYAYTDSNRHIDRHITNYFKQSTSNEFGATYQYQNALYFCVSSSEATTGDQWKTWLSTHNTIVYYVLATSTDTEITDSDLIEQLESVRLLNGLNNISIISNDLTGLIDLHYNFVTGGEVSINDYITSNKILVANTPTGDQAFRITNIDKTRSKIKLIAKHITYDSENYVIADSYVVDKTCNQALDHLNSATDNTSPFTMTSDITTINSYRCVRKSLWEAIGVVLERWGGHLVRNNWSIGVMNSIGADNGVVVRYAKNLKNIQVTYDWNEVVTKILPVGQDGLLLDELYLYADTQYDIPYTKVVHFSQDVDEDLYKDENGQLDQDAYTEALKADLRTQARNYLQVHYIPQVNYELNANLEKITDIGDTIEVIDERLGINLITNLIAYDYDCILERYKTLEFGNFRKNLTDLTTYIDTQTELLVNNEIETTKVTLQEELETATSQLWGILGSSYVLVEGDKILIVDSLPKETATNVIMLNSAGIGFSQTGINGTFSTALTIDGTFNTSNVNVINFTADLIKGGELKLGSNLNQNGILEVYDEANNLIAQLDKNGLRMNAVNGAYVLINQQVGFAGYDRNDNPIYWVSEDEFHMKKSVVEEEITLVDKMRIIPITIENNNVIVNDGIGFVSTL